MKPKIGLLASISRTTVDICRQYPEGILGSIRKIVDTLKNSPNVSVSCFFSGFALEAIESGDRQLLSEICELSSLGRLEILNGPFFEPYPHLLQAEEIRAEFELTGEFWLRHGVERLDGVWLPGNFWQHSLKDILRESSCRYLVTDQSLFTAPASRELLRQAHLLDAEGSPIIVFPSSPCRFFEMPVNWNVLSERILAQAEYEDDPNQPRIVTIPNLLIDPEQSANFDQQGSEVLFLDKLLSAISENDYWQSVCAAEIARRLLEDRPSYLSTIGLRKLDNKTPERDELAFEKRISHRLNDLRDSLATLPSEIDKQPHMYANHQRYQEARYWFLRAQHSKSEEVESSRQEAYRVRRERYRSLLNAQVKIDMIKYTEIDPVQGWVTEQFLDSLGHSGQELVIDTPFIRLYFDACKLGSLLEFDYKPRKINLLNTNTGDQENLSFVGRFLSRNDRGFDEIENRAVACSMALKENQGVVRHNPDLLVSRFMQAFSLQLPDKHAPFSAELYKDFTIRAGLGAHLQNSTSGFSLEYWLEGEEDSPDDLLFSLEFTLMLPSGNPDAMAARPLICAGGEAETVYNLAKPLVLDSAYIPGGLHGVRFIDGIEGYWLDFRSAKSLRYLQLEPLREIPTRPERDEQGEPNYGGTRVRFVSKAKGLFGDISTNTLFVSIP